MSTAMCGESGDTRGGGGGNRGSCFQACILAAAGTRHVPGDAAAAEKGAKAFPTS